MSNDDQERLPNKQDDKHPAPSEVNIGGSLYTGGDDFTERDKHVHGDEVHDDKVMGDKTTVGDVRDSVGVAIGPGATATVTIQEAPKPRIPLERPPRAAHFQDRKEALDKLIAELRPGQVITLCGPGGIGKSALAAEAVWQLVPGAEPSALFPDGVLFHSFYNQPQAALVLEHIARSFGEEIKPSPKEAAQRALAGRRALLVLDGTEQADDLREVVDICDQCGVLVTSRTRRDAIDQRLDVEPLPLEDAVDLLQAWGGLRATNIDAVRHIAELVGRLPLALRLIGRYLAQNEEDAADYLVWLGETPLSALNQGLQREQSVPLLLARSLEQVSETARRVLGMVGLLALAPFPREPIAAALKLIDGESRQAFGELVNYGLLLRRTQAYEVSHALIHTYARLQLPPSTPLVERLAAHYTALIKEHTSDLPLLYSIRPHVMALLRSCRERQAWSAVDDLAWAIEGYLDLQGFWIDRIAALEAGLAATQARQDRQGEGSHLGNLGIAYAHLGQVDKAIAYFEQTLVIAKEIGDRRSEGTALGNLGDAYRNLGQVDKAIAYSEQALVIDREIGDRRGEGNWLGDLGNAYAHLGQVDKAIAYFEQALVIAKEIGDRGNEGNWLGNLGNAYSELGQVDKAIAYSEQALVIAKEIGDRRGEGSRLGNLGIAYYSLGQMDKAITYYEQALVIDREIGDRGGEGTALSNLGIAYAHLGQMDKAIAYYEQALVINREIGDRRGEGAALGNLGIAYYSLGQMDKAIAYYEQVLVIDREIGDRGGEGTALSNLGIAYRNLDQVEPARRSWEQALRIFEEIKSPLAATVREWLSSLKEQ